jgi:hypothetical protein
MGFIQLCNHMNVIMKITIYNVRFNMEVIHDFIIKDILRDISGFTR